MVGDVNGRCARGDRVEGACKAEVEDLHGAVGRDLDVRGFQIAMHDALFVRCGQRVHNLQRNGACLVDRDGASRNTVFERRAFDQLHHERPPVAGLFDSVEMRDVRVVERREHFGFALESREALWIARDVWRKDLERDFALQLRIAGAVHLAHSTSAEHAGDLKRADACAGGERHAGAIVVHSPRYLAGQFPEATAGTLARAKLEVSVTGHNRRHLARQVSSAVVSASGDQGESSSRTFKLCRAGHFHEGPKIDEILRALDVVTRQNLERDQVRGRRDAYGQAPQHFNQFRVGDQLRFDPRRCKEQIDNRGSWVGGQCQPDCRHSTGRFLLDDSDVEVAPPAQGADEGFGVCIVLHRHR